METCKAKKARQNVVGSILRASLLVANDGSILAKLLSINERLDKMNLSNLNIQVILQKSLADQVKKNNKMIMKHHDKMN